MGKPDRYIYELTEKGREELHRWLHEPIGRQIGRHEILLKLVFGSQVSLANNIRQVEHFRDLQYKELKGLGPLEEQLKTHKANNPNLPFWFMADSHMNPSEAVKAFRQLRANHLLIVHWGTFRLGDEPVHHPPIQVRLELEKAGLLDRLVHLNHGETLSYNI